ncbi:MAG TPA: putative metalloprotease CJM1_0395 family protein [Rhodocyclaceae bacterium]
MADLSISSVQPAVFTPRTSAAKAAEPAANATAQGSDSSSNKADQPKTVTPLSPAEQRRVAELQQIDREVRIHEQAHISAGRGVVTSGPTYSYTYGPDGRIYATGGEVGIDTRAERKPQDNIDKGLRIQAAALAPAQPSAQDYRVAEVGKKLEVQGRGDLAREQLAASQGPLPRDAAREQLGRAYGAGESGSVGFSASA